MGLRCGGKASALDPIDGSHRRRARPARRPLRRRGGFPRIDSACRILGISTEKPDELLPPSLSDSGVSFALPCGRFRPSWRPPRDSPLGGGSIGPEPSAPRRARSGPRYSHLPDSPIQQRERGVLVPMAGRSAPALMPPDAERLLLDAAAPVAPLAWLPLPRLRFPIPDTSLFRFVSDHFSVSSERGVQNSSIEASLLADPSARPRSASSRRSRHLLGL